MISVVCPFYNEEAIIGQAVVELLEHLKTLPEPWELLIVNDGSTDGSAEVAWGLEAEYPNLRVISYEANRGRGHALRVGIHGAKGEIIYTTEIDLSWGHDIVHRMHEAMVARPDAQMVVASPHLPGGGYRNIPWHRVFLSSYGNRIIRAGLSRAVTMNTGMTRGYRRKAIETLALYEDGKEFHLEVIMKAIAFGWNVIEIPAVLEWKQAKTTKGTRVRKSSSKIRKLMHSHLLFSALAAPVRYLWPMSAIAALLSIASGTYAVCRYFLAQPYAYAILGAIGFLVFAVLLFSFGVLSEQACLLMRDLWRVQSQLSEFTMQNSTGDEERSHE